MCIRDSYWSAISLIMTRFLWPLECILDDPHYLTFIWHHLYYFACIWYHLHNYIFVSWYCHCLHCLVILIHIVFTMWHWYPWHYFWILYVESHTILHLHWLIKLTKSGLLGETVAGEIQGGVLGRAASPRALPHVFLLFMRLPIITCYMIPEYSELFLPFIRIH